jgi:hypothetical protein
VNGEAVHRVNTPKHHSRTFRSDNKGGDVVRISAELKVSGDSKDDIVPSSSPSSAGNLIDPSTSVISFIYRTANDVRKILLLVFS